MNKNTGNKNMKRRPKPKPKKGKRKNKKVSGKTLIMFLLFEFILIFFKIKVCLSKFHIILINRLIF